MIKFLVAFCLIVCGYKLAPDFGASDGAVLLKKSLVSEDCLEAPKEAENTKRSEPEPENIFYFQSCLPLSIFREVILKSTPCGYLKTSAGYINLAFAPPDFI